MKKTFYIIIIAALSLTACDKIIQSQGLEVQGSEALEPSVEAQITDQESISINVTQQYIDDQLANCETKDSDPANCYFQIAQDKEDYKICTLSGIDEIHDSCLETYSQYMFVPYQLEVDQRVCDEIISTESKDFCYQQLAMVQGDSSLCDQLSFPANCQELILFDNESGDWSLKNYSPDTGFKYTGTAILEGWLIQKPIYANGEPENHFHVSEETIRNLPPIPNLGSDFRLKISSDFTLELEDADELQEKLEQYNQNNPAAIVVDSLETFQEGTPYLGVNKHIDN